MRSGQLVLALAAIGVCVPAVPAGAELVFFTTGRSVSVKSYRVEGDSLVLTLRSGGEVVCEQSIVDRIEADEAPYPEPEAAPQGEARVAAAVPMPAAAAAYASIIDETARREGVDPRLVHAVIQVESGYRANARSPKGAMGLMQLMPATARQYALKNPYDPAANIAAGVKHLKSLLAKFPTALALAAYNAGDAAVQRFGGVPPYAETRSYVSRVLRIVARS
jgi:soluble lytic murein transglycosylase-like protein